MCVSSFYAESWSIFTVPFSVRAELEIDCRQWLVLPRCANSDLPFSISVSSTAGERCCMHFFFYGAQSGRGAFSQRSLPLRLPLSSLLSSTLTASFLIFFFFFNCLAGICMHEANQSELHLLRALNPKGASLQNTVGGEGKKKKCPSPSFFQE